MRLLKASAWYLLFMAALHTVVGLILDFEPLGAMLSDGVGAIDQPHDDRIAALWFMFSGALMFVIAGFAFWSVKRVGALPRFLGFTFLPLGVAGGLIMPLSGFWLYIPVSLVLVFYKQPAEVEAG
jgi:uncharacterized membrane protein